MIKKIILTILIGLAIFLLMDYCDAQKTVECWWGVVYPTLSYIPFEDEEVFNEEKISSSNEHYIPKINDEKPIKFKIAFIEWFKKFF